MMMKPFRHMITAVLLLLSTGFVSAQKYVGGDLSMLLKYEEQGATYLDQDGQAMTDLLAFVKEQGWNTARVRLFVDPSNDTDKAVCQDLEYVKTLGKRIKDTGLYFLLDIHYSDTWADPEHQTIPAMWDVWDWTLGQRVYDYTKDCLTTLTAAGATPDFVQTGNEISFGMLWGWSHDGQYEESEDHSGRLEATSDWTAYTDKHWDHFSSMLKAAGSACREVCPKAKIIIHTEQCANNPTLDVAFFNRLKQYEIDYDIIGTSYYPYFKGPLANLDKGLSALEENFPDKQIQLVETGYPSKWEVQGSTYDYTKTYPYTHEGQRAYTEDLISILKSHPNVNGLSWWYAEANAKGCTGDLKEGWYNASLFDNETGYALPALYELKKFNDGSTGILNMKSKTVKDDWYTLDGRKLDGEPQKGIYIYKGRTIIQTH